jgi:hypothetical protein
MHFFLSCLPITSHINCLDSVSIFNTVSIVILTLSFLIICLNWVFIYRSYQNSIFMLRQGKYDHDNDHLDKYPLYLSTKYFGNHVVLTSVSLIAFFLLGMLFCLI